MTNEPVEDNARAGASVRNKFERDGTARHFPGNTIIALVSPRSPEARLLARTVGHIRGAIALDFVLLPPRSWHMTVFELLCDEVRDADHWSRFLDPAAPFATTDEFFAERVATVAPPGHLVMRYQGISIGENATGLLLEPDDSATARALLQYREELSDATGVRFPDHDAYQFHITLAYNLRRPNAETQQKVDAAVAQAHTELGNVRFRLDPPVLTFFSDMTEFAVGARPTRST